MTKKFFLFFLFSLWLIGESLYNPVGKLKTHGYIKDMEVRGKELLIGSDAGELEVYDLDSKKLKFNVKVPDIKDFMGEVTPARVFGVDRFKDRYLFLSDSGIMGYANLWIYENGKKSLIFDHNAKRALVKARLVDKDHVLYTYLGNDLALFD
ncbi:MAG: hypothetical protein GXO02_02610, partial [Epsilonproteobacteria bacterium]|nr:hypothetical protein [Campylobacterota bacterium]